MRAHMKIHELKTDSKFMAPILSGKKTFEFRKNDREFRVGDILHLREIQKELHIYGEREALAQITYILTHDMFTVVPYGWVILGLALLTTRAESDHPIRVLEINDSFSLPDQS